MLENSTEYQAGWNAWFKGVRFYDKPEPNPYPLYSEQFWTWFRGNRDAMEHEIDSMYRSK